MFQSCFVFGVVLFSEIQIFFCVIPDRVFSTPLEHANGLKCK